MVVITVFILAAITGTLMTSFLIRVKEFSPVRSSSFVTIVLVSLVMIFDREWADKIAPVILGSTFVGMSEPARLGYKSLSLASVVFTFVFLFIIPFNPGFGGALGLGAFCSCILIYGMKILLPIRKY
jgi:hypothetical protein